jgi:Zn-dependent protease
MEESDIYGLMPNPTDKGELPIEEKVVARAPVDEFEASVLDELNKFRNKKGNWLQTALILVVSLMLFLGLGMQENPIAFTVMLIAVLFFHELGHYLGMRIFGYQNVRMFFIPLFGAAVSGRKTHAKSYQEAIVTLLGPVPGLFVAAGLMAICLFFRHDLEIRRSLIWAAMLFGMINAFNLLPIFPLDGGRLLNQVLFARNRYLEGVFLTLAGLALLSFGAFQGKVLLSFLGIWILMSVSSTFKINGIARQLGECYPSLLPSPDETMPIEPFRAIVHEIRSQFPKINAPKNVAGIVQRIWEKMQSQPLDVATTVSLLLAYLLACLFAIPWLLLLLMPVSKQ